MKFTRGKTEAFLERYATDAKVLDIGARAGEHTEYFPNAVSIDIDPDRKPDIVADARELPFQENTFEGIVCSEVLEHIPDPARAIAEMRRVLIPGGFVVLTTRFLFPIHDAPGDFFRFTPYALRELFKGWEIAEIVPENGPFGALAVQLQRIIFQTELRGGKATKLVLYILARMLLLLDRLVMRTYGDICKSERVPILMASGVYIRCNSPKSKKQAKDG